MSDIPAFIGDLSHGGLVAGAVEPAHGGRDGHSHETACLNCGTPLIGPHCHQCGQHGHVHRTLSAFFHDLLHGVFHFEGKTWRTLPLLAWRPGQLTREYIDGRRASYVSPIALFLFVVFVTFALFSALGGGVHMGKDISLDAGRSITEAKTDLDARIARADKRRARALAAHEATTRYDAELKSLREDRATLDKVSVPQDAQRVTGNGRGGAVLASGVNAVWQKAKENPALLVYKLQSSAYKYSWLLIPISVPFLWLLFPFSRRFRAYDHTVFVTYSISFMLVMIALTSLGAYFSLTPLVVLPLLYMPLHMYRQLKGTYGLSRAGALWRTAAMLQFASIALALFALALVMLVLY